MNKASRPSDDLPSNDERSRQLYGDLMDVVSERFWGKCEEETQELLSKCGWDVTIKRWGLTLIVVCPNQVLYQQVVGQIEQIGKSLQQLSPRATIQIYPPAVKGG